MLEMYRKKMEQEVKKTEKFYSEVSVLEKNKKSVKAFNIVQMN